MDGFINEKWRPTCGDSRRGRNADTCPGRAARNSERRRASADLTLAGAFLKALAMVKEALREIDDEEAKVAGRSRQPSHDLAETMDDLFRRGAISESVLLTVATADQYSEGLAHDLGQLLIGPHDPVRAELTQLINSLDSVVSELEAAQPKLPGLKMGRLDDSGGRPRALLRMLTDQANQANKAIPEKA